MNAHTPPPTTMPEDGVIFESDLNALHRHCRILCSLAEDTEKNVAALRTIARTGGTMAKLGSGCEIGDDLVTEQAYAVRVAVERLQALWREMFRNEEIAA